MEKILVIRFGTVGDSIFASAFYRELRKSKPEAVIDALCDDIAEGVMRNCPYINNIIKMNGDKYKEIPRYLKIFKEYETVYFLKNDKFFSVIAFLAGVKNRIGFNVRRNKFLTKKSPYNCDRHEVDCYLDLLRINEIEVSDDKTEVWISDSATEKISEMISKNEKKKVLIQVYSRFTPKNWLDTYWVEIIRYLSDKLDIQVYYSGGGKDVESYAKLSKLLGEVKNTPIDMSGKLSVEESMALIKKMDLVIGIDSCSVHMAAALDIPSILIHGATSIVRWRPRSEKCVVLSKFFACSPCCLQPKTKKLCKNKTPECMKALYPNNVIVVLDSMFTQVSEINKPKVSVIVPVYNVEKYLPRCLDSIIHQTLKDIEIICVDDGSKDFSSDILKEFSKRDKRIKIIKKENGGLSDARNVGMNAAAGEYISFVDSDDWLSLDFLENLYTNAKDENADIAVASVIRSSKNVNTQILKYKTKSVHSDFTKKLEVCDVPSHCYVWNKIYKREMLLKSNIKFEKGRIYEDVIFTPQILYASNKLVVVPEGHYYYFRHKNTLVKRQDKKAKNDLKYAMNKSETFLKEHNADTSVWETTVKRYRLFGLTIFKTITKRNQIKCVLFNFIRWQRR